MYPLIMPSLFHFFVIFVLKLKINSLARIQVLHSSNQENKNATKPYLYEKMVVLWQKGNFI